MFTHHAHSTPRAQRATLSILMLLGGSARRARAKNHAIQLVRAPSAPSQKRHPLHHLEPYTCALAVRADCSATIATPSRRTRPAQKAAREKGARGRAMGLHRAASEKRRALVPEEARRCRVWRNFAFKASQSQQPRCKMRRSGAHLLSILALPRQWRAMTPRNDCLSSEDAAAARSWELRARVFDAARSRAGPT